MLSRAIFTFHWRLALLVGSFVAGPAIVYGQTISTIAGNGAPSYAGDGGFATSAALNQPKGIAFDASGNMYIADRLNHRIRRVTPTGTISTFAGTGIAGYSGDGGPATAAMLNQPEAVVFDTSGSLIIADSQNRRIRKVNSSTGIITTIAGTGTEGYSGDGGLASLAMLHRAVDLAVDTSGNIYFADSVDNRIRKISTNGIITTVAGTGVAGYSGDFGPATSATLSVPVGVAVDSAGNIYIADAENHVIRKVTPGNGLIFTVAGNGMGAGTDTGSFSGDGGLASQAGLNTPEGIAVDPAGNYYIADTENYRIRKVTVTASSNVITTIAGTGTDGFSGDGGLAIQATMNLPWSVALDASGNLFVGDMMNNRIREITLGPGTTPGSPAVTTGGIVNTASYSLVSPSVAPGSIAAVFGKNLTDGTSCLPPTCNSSLDVNNTLKTTMAGAQVTINGTPVPIFFATPSLLAIQIPTELAALGTATLQVTVGSQTSTAQTLSVRAAAPGIFTTDTSGAGQGAILNGVEITQGVASLVAPVGSFPNAHPARPGDVVVIFCTGLGAVAPPIATGVLPSSQTTVSTPHITVDGLPAELLYSGLTPGDAGLYQINVRVPAAARSSANIPVTVEIAGSSGNTVTIAVQQ